MHHSAGPSCFFKLSDVNVSFEYFCSFSTCFQANWEEDPARPSPLLRNRKGWEALECSHHGHQGAHTVGVRVLTRGLRVLIRGLRVLTPWAPCLGMHHHVWGGVILLHQEPPTTLSAAYLVLISFPWLSNCSAFFILRSQKSCRRISPSFCCLARFCHI